MINEIITFLGKIKMTDWIAIIALIVSLISLITSFFHPEIRRWMKRKFMSNKLNFIAIDNLILFFNQGGSFIRLSVTLQPPNDAMTIKNIAVEIKRNKTKECRTLTWSAFLPLISQSVGVVQIDTFSEAVPERILQDDIKTFKLEFSDTDNQRKSKLNRLVASAASTVAKLDISKNVKELKQELKQHPLECISSASSPSGSQSGGSTDKFKLNCNKSVAKTAIRLNVITPAKLMQRNESYCESAGRSVFA